MISPRRTAIDGIDRRQLPDQSCRLLLVMLRFLSRRHLNEKKARVVASGFDLGRDPMSKRHEIVGVDPNADLFELRTAATRCTSSRSAVRSEKRDTVSAMAG